jgi:hypothetical protein
LTVAVGGETAMLKSLTPLTTSATVFECTSAPEVPVMVRVSVAMGVAVEVVTVRVELATLVPGVTDAGLNEQVAPVGSPEQDSVIELPKLLVGCTATL